MLMPLRLRAAIHGTATALLTEPFAYLRPALLASRCICGEILSSQIGAARPRAEGMRGLLLARERSGQALDFGIMTPNGRLYPTQHTVVGAMANNVAANLLLCAATVQWVRRHKLSDHGRHSGRYLTQLECVPDINRLAIRSKPHFVAVSVGRKVIAERGRPSASPGSSVALLSACIC